MATLVDKDVWEKVKAVVNTPEKLRQALGRRESEAAEIRQRRTEKLESVEAVAAHAEERVRSMVASITDATNEFVRTEFKSRLPQAVKDMEAAQAKRDKYRASMQRLDAHLKLLEALERVLSAFGGVDLDALTYAEKRQLLRFLGVQVDIYRDGGQPAGEDNRWVVGFDWEGFNDATEAPVPVRLKVGDREMIGTLVPPEQAAEFEAALAAIPNVQLTRVNVDQPNPFVNVTLGGRAS